ncbi:MAG: Calcineurin-like phosphoesterase [Verrucomicrobia bacterium ADurb.Bin118]|nr:MAG: Calcineurin-like phosphoesterase [Verrucomicrobia bacterium ADurb.Bin118]
MLKNHGWDYEPMNRLRIQFLLVNTLILSWGASIHGAVIGQWDFNSSNLTATVGTALAYRGDTAGQTTFTTKTIAGETAVVMAFPATTPTQGYVMTHGIAPNGGGSAVNQFTLIMDVMYPAASANQYRALLQTSTGNANDADLFVGNGNGIGTIAVYHGTVQPDTWHRLAFVFDLTLPNGQLRKFIDGNLVGVQDLTSGADGRWSLDPTALLFTDDDGETKPGFVNSIQIHDVPLPDSYLASLGGPTAAGIPEPPPASPYAQYDFNGNLNSSVGGLALTTGYAAPATSPGVTFTTQTIGGSTAQVASFTRGTYFSMNHGLGGNGGGAQLNQYTLIMDVMFPSRPSGWAVLYQSNPANSDDGEWFINPSQSLGISANYGGLVPDGTWNRLAVVVDNVAGTFTSYVNGAQVQQNDGLELDGRWALGPTFLLFADNDEENSGGFINSVQLRPEAMLSVEVDALGGASAAGIPAPAPPDSLQVVSPNGGEDFQAGSTQTIAWTVNHPSGLVRIDLYRGGDWFQTLGQTALSQSNFLWDIHPMLGDTNNYRIHLTSLNVPSLTDASDGDFSVHGSTGELNPLFGQPLETNGDFEQQATGWQVIAGNPLFLTSSGGKGNPHGGSRFFHGGTSVTSSNTIIRQDIDLIAKGFTPADLDSGTALDAEAWLRTPLNPGAFDDQVSCRIGFLDATDEEISAVRSMIAGNNVWQRRQLSGLLPAGTRKLRVEIIADHRRDADNDGMADDIVVRLQKPWPLSPSPQITKLPMLQDYRTNAMRLFWETDGNLTRHYVDWGRSNVTENTISQIETVQIDATHFVHRATIRGLETEQPYVYRVRSGSTATPNYGFRTAPYPDTPFAVAWWSDSQTGPGVLHQLIPSMITNHVDWMGVSGDLASSGNSLHDWKAYWFDALEFDNIAQTRPALFSRGNHDAEYAFSYAYSVLPGNGAWYAFDYGNSRFIFLDSEASTSASPEQYAWLVNELSRPETQRAAFRVVSFHRLPYANLWNGGGYTGETWVRNDWVPLFRQYHVDMVINGHSHNYNRGITNGVTYTVVGGGGGYLDTERVAFWPVFTEEFSLFHYALMQINGRTMTWTAHGLNDEILDATTLPSRVPELALERNNALVLAGKPGETYVIESSPDLQTWTAWATYALPDTGTGRWTNTITVDSTFRAYRARTSN